MNWSERKQNFEWHWSHNLMLAGIFCFLFCFGFIIRNTAISFVTLSKMLFLFGLIGILLPKKFYLRLAGISGIEIVFFNVLGVGPLITSGLLVLNFFVTTHEKQASYEVTKMQEFYSVFYDNGAIIVELENEKYQDFQVFRTIELDPGQEDLSMVSGVIIKSATGILGFEVLIENRVERKSVIP